MRIEIYKDGAEAGIVIDWKHVTDVLVDDEVPEITFVVNHKPYNVTWTYDTMEERDRDVLIIKHYLKTMGEEVNPPGFTSEEKAYFMDETGNVPKPISLYHKEAESRVYQQTKDAVDILDRIVVYTERYKKG